MNVSKFAAIDIGSNAMRLLIMMVVENEKTIDYKKISLVRLPIRLGQEAFSNQFLSKETVDKFLSGMKAFKLIMDIHEIEGSMAVATSAMREAKNGKEVTQLIKNETGIDIEIIDGKKEAEIIFNAHFDSLLNPKNNYLYVDVGGGSTEVTILSESKIIATKSFKIGSIRLLNDLVTKEQWRAMKEWVKLETKDLEHIETIGSGGNINKVYKLMNLNFPQPILYHELQGFHHTLTNMSNDQRIQTFKLNEDRADVIVPATSIYFSVMKWSDSSIIHVPKMGLSDGIITMLYENSKLN